MKQRQQPEPKPGVIVGDEVYVHHDDGPRHGRVVAHGVHGVTVDVDGQQHRVRWERVLGHRKRAAQQYTVVDEGEDGILVEDAHGKRQFIAVPPEAREDKMMVKANGTPRIVMLTKSAAVAAAAYAGRPGLQKKQITDKRGVQTTRWVRTDQGAPPAQAGHHVGFQNGEHRGHGQVMASGKDGVTLRDPAGGVHRVPHGNVTHHWGGEGAPTESLHPKAAANDSKKPFFEPADIEGLPNPKTWRHDAFKDWAGAEKLGKEGLAQYTEMLDKLGAKLGFEKATGSPDEMSDEQINSNASYLFMGPLKKQDKSTAKVMNDYDGDWGRLKDLVRATVAVKSVDDVHRLLGGLKETGVKFAQAPKDNMTNGTPDGYRDLNMIVLLPNGMPAELQVQVKAITKAKAAAHEHYNHNIAIEQRNKAEGKRDISEWSDKDKQSFANNRNSMKKLYGEAWAQATGEPYQHPTPEGGATLQKSQPQPIIIFVERRRE